VIKKPVKESVVLSIPGVENADGPRGVVKIANSLIRVCAPVSKIQTLVPLQPVVNGIRNVMEEGLVQTQGQRPSPLAEGAIKFQDNQLVPVLDSVNSILHAENVMTYNCLTIRPVRARFSKVKICVR
jgi:hypothetical protein